MTIRKVDKNKTSWLEMCKIIKALGSVSVHSDDAFSDRYRTALMSIANALIERIESYYLPEKRKYEVVVKPNKIERIVVEAESIEEAKSNACDKVDDMLGGNHDGLLVVSCEEVK